SSRPPHSTIPTRFPYTTLFRSLGMPLFIQAVRIPRDVLFPVVLLLCFTGVYVATNSVFDLYAMLGFGVLGYGMNKFGFPVASLLDRKSTRLNSSHVKISYAVFC